MPSVISIEDLTKQYYLGEEVITALHGVSLQVERGQFVAIMGASGSGKTTLLHLTGGLDLPDSGRVLLNGNSLTEMSDQQRTLFRRRHLGIVFQSFNLLPTLTARENVMLPLLVDGRPAAEISRRADELIATVRLDHRSRHRPAALSGGEQQRVAIARALINSPVLVLADEPTGNLDSASAESVFALMRSINREQATSFLVVTHNLDLARRCDRIVEVVDGRIASAASRHAHG
jgi:ABC-type lipoprotein export system ATPase subunit